MWASVVRVEDGQGGGGQGWMMVRVGDGQYGLNFLTTKFKICSYFIILTA